MAYKRAPGHSNAGSDGDIHVRFSDDYGNTWTDEDTDLDSNPVTGMPIQSSTWGDGTNVTEPLLCLAPDGTLLLHLWRYNWTTGTGDGAYQSKSSDGGKTWSAPASIGLTGSTDASLTFTTDDFTLIGDVIYAGCSFKGAGTGKEGVVKSEDNGATWNYVANIATSGTIEVGLEYVGNNTLVAVLRDSNNVGAYISRSTNTALTWSAKEGIGHIIDSSGRHRLKTDKHLKGEADWWADDRLVMWGYAYEGVDRRSCFWFSKDKGVNWSAPHYVETAYQDAGYGDVFYNPNTDEYVFVTYRGTQASADLMQYNLTVDWGE